MEGVGQWRLIEPQEAEDEVRQPAPAEPRSQRGTFIVIVATTALVVAAVGLAIWATLPTGSVTVDSAGPVPGGVFSALDGQASVGGSPAGASPVVAAAASDLVIDIQGAVTRPGVHTLPAGSRITDAIAAAGGYAPAVDIAAASWQLNLAAKLVDGQQIHVPALGDVPVDGGGGADAAGGDAPESGLIDLNTAAAEELDTLPGIGPVTAAKIIDARTEASFSSVEELLARGVVGESTFEKIRDLVSVGP